MSYHSRLQKAFEGALRLPLNNCSKYVLFSDCHRGTGTSNDNFQKKSSWKTIPVSTPPAKAMLVEIPPAKVPLTEFPPPKAPLTGILPLKLPETSS